MSEGSPPSASSSFAQGQPEQRPGPPAGTTTAVSGFPPQSPVTRRKPKKLGKDLEYYEDRIIGQGVFGVVYYGRTRPEGRPLAVKLFRDIPTGYSRASLANIPEVNTDDDPPASGSHLVGGERAKPAAAATGKDAFPEEIRVLMELKAARCPNIIEMHSSWNRRKNRSPRADGDGQPLSQHQPAYGSLYRRGNREFLLVTEYCAGGDLLKLQRQLRGRLSETAARSLIYQLCNALLVLLRRKIIHRDIKPANLLLTSTDPEVATLKLADWGMAKLARQNHCQQLRDADFNDDPMQGAGMFYSHVGTPMYKSPERIRQEAYSFKADVYSAGMVLYELMTGSVVRARTQEDLLEAVPRAIRNQYRRYEGSGGGAGGSGFAAATTTSESRPQVSVPLWLDLVKGMTETDPKKRMSVEDVLRHPWFLPVNGPPLPPLTVPLSPQPQPSPTEPRNTQADARATNAMPSAPPPEEDDSASEGGTAGVVAARHVDAAQTSTPPLSPPQGDAGAGVTAARTPSSLQPSPSLPFGHTPWWTLLARLPWPCTHTDLAAANDRGRPSGTFAAAAASSQPASPLTSTADRLPSECGPHIVTHAARYYTHTLLSGAVLQDGGLSALEALTVLAFAKELVTSGYAVFSREVELHGCVMPPATVDVAGVTEDDTPVISREYSELHRVWDTLRGELDAALVALVRRVPSESERTRLTRLLSGTESTTETGARAEAILFSRALTLTLSGALEDRLNEEADSSSSSSDGEGGNEERSTPALSSAEAASGTITTDDAEEPLSFVEARALLHVLQQQVVLTDHEVGQLSSSSSSNSTDHVAARAYLVHVPLMPAPQDKAHALGGWVVDHLQENLVNYAMARMKRLRN